MNYAVYAELLLSTVDDNADWIDLTMEHLEPKNYFDLPIHPWYVSQLTAELDDKDYKELIDFLYGVFKMNERFGYYPQYQFQFLGVTVYDDCHVTIKVDPYHCVAHVFDAFGNMKEFEVSHIYGVIELLRELAECDDEGIHEWADRLFRGE